MHDRLRAHLARHGPQSGRELCVALGISQPTLSRLVRSAGHEVLTVGKARNTRYAWRRGVEGVVAPVPVYEVGRPGTRARHVADLHPVAPRGFMVVSREADVPAGWAQDLPWWLQDLRPSGYLGRLVPLRHPELRAPPDPRLWSSDVVVRYLMRHGWDGVGAFVLGDEAFRAYLQNAASPAGIVSRHERGARYLDLVGDALHQATPGSSAAGEHPKLLAVRDDGDRLVPVLVKFSPATTTPADVRRADLLVAEHHALSTIAAHGHPAASSEVIFAGGRAFLEVERFDRQGVAHRIGQVTLEMLDAELVGGSPTWTDAAEALLRGEHVTRADVEEIRWREAFGRWIANNDMHLANLSFRVRGARLDGVAPVYDIQPALYQPVAGELVERTFEPVLPRVGDPTDALDAAVAFWVAVADDPRVSDGFRGLSAVNAAAVTRLKATFDLLPVRSPISRA